MSMPQQTPAAIGPILIDSLHLTRAEVGLLTSAIWGGMLLGMLPSGILIDRFGERIVVATGAAAMAVFLLFTALTSTFLPIFLLLLAAAIGAASSSPGGTRAIAAWFERHERGLAMGIRQTGVTAAGILAAVLLPPIALAYGWQAAFRSVAVLAVLAAVLFALFYREPTGLARAVSAQLEVVGLLRNSTFVRATIFGWLFMGVLGSAIAYLTLSLHQQQGLSVVQAGVFLGLLQFGGVLGRVGWGLLSDRLGSRSKTMSLTGSLAVLSCLAMAGSGLVPLPAGVLALVVLLLGLSAMGWNALYITLSAELGPATRAASVVGLGTTLTFTGMFAVTPLFGLVADRTGSYTLSWICLAALAAVGVFTSLGIREPRSAGHEGGWAGPGGQRGPR